MLRAILTAAALIASLAPAGCGSKDSSGTPSGSDPRAAGEGSIGSSIADGSDLTTPVTWEARIKGLPPAEVVSVRFLIDGRLAHVERQPPYVFAGDGNQLLPGTLKPGTHTFAVDAETRNGPRLTAASTATIAGRAAGVPPELVGRWTRHVSAADVQRTEEIRTERPGEQPLPVGVWQLRIGADSVARFTDPTPTHDLTVGQLRFAPRHRLIAGNVVPNFPGADGGGFCPDPVTPGAYTWTLHGDTLAVRLEHDRACADRNSFWTGTFTR